MALNSYVLLVIVSTCLVTWASRVIPFILLKRFKLSKLVVSFLGFVPICIMTALWMQSLFVQHLGQLPDLNVPNVLASIPTLLSAVLTKNLLVIVIVGVVSLGVLNLIL
ncbi:AzlD domain-containing protein [Secundilactobacillus folii]|uniref:AzlD domain-containing protein n=1 Tax=Secundilactobacillus folii TaxID=2678357 RepID=A0A7X3C2W4_9LACO|nr:AzlD domain-containing protein [Secundilactobacillus folii]MTV83265.1 AzlD domain-containing protein [Secundilactobacillus folii]